MSNNKILLLLLSLVLLSSCSSRTDNIIDLSGSWEFRLDSDNKGINEGWMDMDFENRIELPGTTDEAGYGNPTVDTAYGILSREFEYIGPAWYIKKINIPEDWLDKEISIFLERVLWESRVYIDGKLFGIKDALGTPHIHNLGIIAPGEHRLSIRINNDMVHNIGDKGHAYGEYMQSIWNGIVGRIELQAQNPIHITGVRTFPDPAFNRLTVEIETKNPSDEELNYLFILREKKSQKVIHTSDYLSKEEKLEITFAPENEIRPWSEFDPFLYELEVQINPTLMQDQKVVSFGFVKVGKNQHHVLINNEPVFLRGNLDCIHFPLTGYPSMGVNEWKRIFNVYKDYGLNHVRFHSWCPPEAAFDAADELGIYIQTEASLWIDWWMGTDMVARGRPEMNTKGHPKGIGRGDLDADKFVRDEMQRVVDTYGNHPSFIMFCIGNELGSSDFDLMGKWIQELKEMDPRRLYAASTARTITLSCDYSATHNVPGIGGVRQKMVDHNNWDYEERYSRAEVPIIAHEIGQWPVYPEWSEINKYTGALKPRNLEQLAEISKVNGLFEMDKEFRLASGQLSALLYKDEIESFMRTPSCAGYQLLSMQDYIGQGEAVIGWLDSFYESKDILDPETARQYMNTVVPLIRMSSYTWYSGDTIQASVLLHQYGPENLSDHVILWELLDEDGKKLLGQQFPPDDYAKGMLHQLGELYIPLPEITNAGAFRIRLVVNGTNYMNSWPIWVYPKELAENDQSVFITKKYDQQTRDSLAGGAKVLLLAHEIGSPELRKFAAWKPLYWSASFFPGQSIETLGLMVPHDHAALASFPTENFGSWNWWNICQGAHGFVLDGAPDGYQAIVQPVSDFHFSHRLGSIFETKVGIGKLLVCGYNLSSERDTLPEVRQLRYSLIQYMESGAFDPEYELDSSFLAKLFPQYELAGSDAPEGFSEAVLYVEAAKK